jgi:hypothetical protein
MPDEFLTIEVDVRALVRQLAELGKLDAVKAALQAGAAHVEAKIKPKKETAYNKWKECHQF